MLMVARIRAGGGCRALDGLMLTQASGGVGEGQTNLMTERMCYAVGRW